MAKTQMQSKTLTPELIQMVLDSVSDEQITKTIQDREEQRLAKLKAEIEPRKAAYLKSKAELDAELDAIRLVDPMFQLGGVALSAAIERAVKESPGMKYSEIAAEVGTTENVVSAMIEKNLKKSKPTYTKDAKGGISLVPETDYGN